MKKIYGLLMMYIIVGIISCSYDPDKTRRLSQVQSTGVEVFVEDQEVPDLKLLSIAGEEMSLSEFGDGKHFVLNFWASWCAPCVKELPLLQALHDALKDSGFAVLTINVDPPGSETQIKKLLSSMKLSIPVLLDPELFSIEKFSVSGFPESFYICNNRFCPMTDPVTRTRTIRIKGDREWSSPEMVSIIKEVMSGEK